MSTTYLKYYLKSNLTSPYLWGWSIGFMVFWLLMGVLQAGGLKARLVGLPESILVLALKSYTAGWYASVAVIGLGSAAVSLCYEFYYASLSARYVTKYSKITEARMYLYHVLGFTIVCLVVAGILLAVAAPMYSAALGAPMDPENPAGLFAATVLLGLLYYCLAATLIYASIVLRRPRAAMMLSYAPLVLSLGLVLSSLTVDYGWGLVVSPFNAAALLIWHYYTGAPPRLCAQASCHSGAPAVSPALLWASLAAWTSILAVLAVILLRAQRGVGAEELRLF